MGQRHAGEVIVLYLELVLVCVIGAILQSAIGFGFPIFAMIFFSAMFPFQTAVTITQTAGILGVGYFFVKYFRHVKWKALLPFLLSAVPVGMLCTIIGDGLPVGGLKVYLGVVLVLIAAFFLFFDKKTSIKANTASGIILGGTSGVLNGFFAIGGPPVALYLLPATNDKISYIATANAYFFLFKIANLALRFTNGSVGIEHAGLIVLSIVSMVAGSLIGDKVMNMIPMAMLKKLVYIFVAISGIVIVVQELM